MKYDNRLYPHPVLGISDDVEGEFFCNLTVESDSKYIILKPLIKLVNGDLESLIKTEGANICMQVNCRGVLFRNNYIIKDLITDEIKIEANSLNGETEVDFFICAAKDIENYKNSQANDFFTDQSFLIEKGDILAYGGKGKFFANKSPEQLRAVSSFVKVRRGGFKDGPFLNDYDDKYITIVLSDTDYDRYSDVKNNNDYTNVLHASLVLPSLVQAVYFIKDKDSGSSAYEGSDWHKILTKLLDEEKRGGSDFEKIQYILDLPMNRLFISLEDLMLENEA